VSAAPLRRLSVSDELAAALRDRILDGDVPAGAPLRELELAEAYGVSRHTLRAALRTLAGDGLVRIEPNRGAAVAHLGADDVRGLFELRTAIELEAAYLALERHAGRLPGEVHDAVDRLTATCERARPSWRAVATAHADVHGAIVHAAGSQRIKTTYAALAAELQLFLVQLRPVWPLERMVSHHRQLVRGLEREGTVALRRHLRDGAEAVLAAGVLAGAGRESASADSRPRKNPFSSAQPRIR
jgi:DNA-binding GntR family transcriptional regulator